LYDEVTIGNNPIKFSNAWSDFPDDKEKHNRAEISNDTNEYKSLTIVGNTSAGFMTIDGKHVRRVGVWDRLDVHGELYQMVTLIECGGADDWIANVNHPVRKYFREKLKNQPKGTILHAMGDLPAWAHVYWIGWVGNDGLIKVAWTSHQQAMNVG
jgi:hypothetical protein